MGMTLLAIFIVTLDQLTKFAVKYFIKGREPVIIIRNFFALTYVENRGAAWGFLGDKEAGSFFLKIVSLLATLFLLMIFTRLNDRRLKYILSIILAGSVGNLIDRFIFSYVTDFLTFKFGHWYFPSFNIADIAIVIGTFLLILYFLFHEQAMDEFIEAIYLFKKKSAKK